MCVDECGALFGQGLTTAVSEGGLIFSTRIFSPFYHKTFGRATAQSTGESRSRNNHVFNDNIKGNYFLKPFPSCEYMFRNLLNEYKEIVNFEKYILVFMWVLNGSYGGSCENLHI